MEPMLSMEPMGIVENFKFFLKSKGVSPLTQKNYLSDVRYFLKWVKESGLSGKSVVSGKAELFWFNQTAITTFKNSLISSQTPPTTINRRLSALRQFGEFLVKQGWLKQNPAKIVSGVSGKSGISREKGRKEWQFILSEFKGALKNQKQKEATIKNYLSDVRQFLLFSSREN